MKWEWEGRRLADPLTIARRLLALPVFMAGKCLAFIGALIGWGWDSAMQVWRGMD